MYQPVIEMEKILKEERSLYEKIYLIEENKKEAILERNGKLIQEFSEKQEELLSRITELEISRENQIERYKKLNKIADYSRPITLKEIVQSMDEDSSHHLLRIGMELKEVMLKISDLQKLNKKLINDNMEFYNLLISSLKGGSTIESGYSSKGKEESRAVNPVFINKTA